MDEIISKISTLLSHKELVLVAIDGVGGAGKTTLANKIKSSYEKVTIIQMDDFYSPQMKKPDIKRLAEEVLEPLVDEQTCTYKIYDWKKDFFLESIPVAPDGVVIIEGVFSLDQSIRNYIDIRIWIHCSPETGLKRGIERDKAEYGIDTTDKWINDWMPKEKEYRDTQKPAESADIVFDS